MKEETKMGNKDSAPCWNPEKLRNEEVAKETKM